MTCRSAQLCAEGHLPGSWQGRALLDSSRLRAQAMLPTANKLLVTCGAAGEGPGQSVAVT